MKKKLRLSFNAPAVLTFTALCVIAQLISMLTHGESNRVLFSVYRASLLDPLTWVRCFTHVLGHAGWEHLLGNIMYILILGPMIEEKYGTATTAFIMAATALVIGIINMVFFPGVMLLGASGIVFAFILIASITIREDNTIPVTFILVAVLYLGQQIWQGLFSQDNVSQMAHIVGGAVGAVLGFLLGRAKQKRSPY
ncbi:rhomboid family intramembrane serine protease [Aristaeella hokkaidonensis]|uniref:Rhomboid family intramembrane serine protease n=1 Tax=Aristaeella hokkaidonensis TaxID=3046382 RepID=A0AC61N3W1_9FIRM|nr:rhomboid family intramembrane serine protease [Aristaeella hokkaidonensis]QUC66151.1 rhomboid family intramembrane serine protease [Aristaeella hokkaidonensis]SNT94843.1 GlpG protein [Aristaeella hokkaidonensis]